MASKFFEQIKTSVIEREVEDVYNKGISLYFTENITHPFACDGLVETTTESGKMLKLIIEYKFDEEMTSKVARAKVIAQVLFYLKRFENEGLALPNVCLVGDIDECFCFHTNDILSYLDEDVDWTLAPSSAGNCTELVFKIANDENINPFIFEVNENFSFKEVAEKIKALADNVQRFVRVTEHNISNIFDYFCKKVVKDTKKIQPNDLVAIFMGVITDAEEYYQHPSKKNVLVCKGGKQIAINGDGFKSFFSYFNRNYTPQEKNKFAEISDRLIEDTNRRNKGEFYTPTLFVDYAHKMIAEQFGEDWKDKYVVWDNCSGTKNLTRDYYFKELYCSTLENAELEISERYNREGTSFQFDFLNDSLDKLPQGLKDALENNKPLIFFINPPYATSSTFTADKQKEDGVAESPIAKKMREDGMDLACRNLFAQFLYRIKLIKQEYKLTDCHIALFCKPSFINSPSYNKFRGEFFKHFAFDGGVFFKASEFADVSDKWGIIFDILSCGETKDTNEFEHTLIYNENGEIVEKGKKTLYNCDGMTDTSKWVREVEISKNKVDMPIMKSGVAQFENPKNKSIGQLTDDAIGCYYHIASDVYHSATYVALFTANCSHPSGKWSITPTNFDRVVSTFASRKLITETWENSADVFIAPNTENDKWQEFVNDSIVYSLFTGHSQQSSLRNIEYKGKLWDIKNEFFFMSKDEVMELANENNLDFTYNDARVSSDRYVYTKLQGLELSNEAREVLDKARELTIKSFRYRELFNEEHPEYQILNWDASYYQLKGMLKEFMPNELKEFNDLFKALADKMRPMVYELGFLK